MSAPPPLSISLERWRTYYTNIFYDKPVIIFIFSYVRFYRMVRIIYRKQICKMD